MLEVLSFAGGSTDEDEVVEEETMEDSVDVFEFVKEDVDDVYMEEVCAAEDALAVEVKDEPWVPSPVDVMELEDTSWLIELEYVELLEIVELDAPVDDSDEETDTV